MMPFEGGGIFFLMFYQDSFILAIVVVIYLLSRDQLFCDNIDYNSPGSSVQGIL